METISLNGWWDILPVYGEQPDDAPVPREGWETGRYLVPSFWTTPVDGVRRKGEDQYRKGDWAELPDDAEALERDWEFLFDIFGYPRIWSKTRRAWVRRSFELSVPAGRRALLHFDAVAPRCRVYLNGVLLGDDDDPTLPFEFDATDALRDGENELALYIDDYRRDSSGRIETPCGNDLIVHSSGIWQNVSIRLVTPVRLLSPTIRSRVRESLLEIEWTAVNDSAADFTGEVTTAIRDMEGDELFRAAPETIAVAANSRRIFRQLLPVGDALPPWTPEAPALCEVVADFAQDVCRERFGWREITIEAGQLKLNGRNLHLFSDWGHKYSLAHHTEGWTRSWLAMIRDANQNHSRLHAFPHPPLTLDLADELGILITDETALYGSGNVQASGSDAYWDAARRHVRRLVARDRNHPSVILWSVENEMRWNLDAAGKTCRNLPELRALFEELDPTRFAYHDGDSSLWSEADQPIISRHYGKECSGIGWWNHRQVLSSGEMAEYHMAGPNNSCHLGGDAVWRDSAALKQATALDAAWIIEDARTLGVACLGPWNLSCLENYRFHPEMHFEYPDWSAPGIKPLHLAAGACEFEYWKTGGADVTYHPSEVFELQRHAFRPFAAIDRNRRGGYFKGDRAERTVYWVNDRPEAACGSWRAVLEDESGRILAEQSGSAEIRAGEVGSAAFAFDLALIPAGTLRYRVRFTARDGEVLDTLDRIWRVRDRVRPPRIHRSVRLLGAGRSRNLWQSLGICVETVADPDQLTGGEILIVEAQTALAPEKLHAKLEKFAARGGRILLLEHESSLLGRHPFAILPLQKVHIRCASHPVFTGIDPDDLAFWGDGAYSDPEPDNLVVQRLYAKGDGTASRPLLDGGNGTFGNGSLEFAALLEGFCAPGMLLACQLRLTGCAGRIPAARQLAANLLGYLDRDEAATSAEAIPVLAPAEALEAAHRGRTVMSCCRTNADAALFGLELVEAECRQLVAAADAPDGFCNEDACGIVSWTYAPPAAVNTVVARRLLRPNPALTAWLESAPGSGLTELFERGGKTEALRAHTLSEVSRRRDEPRPVGAGLLTFGAGRVLLWQLEPEAARPRFERLRHAAEDALGGRQVANLFAFAPEAHPHSNGAPEKMRVGDAAGLSEADFKTATHYTPEHLSSGALERLTAWREVATPDGRLILAGEDAPETLAIGFHFYSECARPDFDPDLRVPNPEAMTVVEIAGDGEVELYVNGVLRRSCRLTGEHEPVAIGDIYPAIGHNPTALRWTRQGAKSLRIRFRTLLRKPETELFFGV